MIRLYLWLNILMLCIFCLYLVVIELSFCLDKLVSIVFDIFFFRVLMFVKVFR